ncbi:hypothetical protein HQ531_02820 [bacterium]|nr:hypothetical protein [bacterium]
MGKISYYEEGDLHTRTFLAHVTLREQIRGEYYEVVRNNKGLISSAKHFSAERDLIEKSRYTYSRKGTLTRHHLTEYFHKGPPRNAREWMYINGQVVKQEEMWFTRSRALEKKLTIHYDAEGKNYLEETWGLAGKIESSTEYYYDFKHRLDKSRRNFFYPDGDPRDYWLTIYNDENQIISEEHYLPDNSLLAFYRYAYHPVQAYREHEEILEEDRNIFISRRFDEYGLILEESQSDRELRLLKRTVYEYNDKYKPKLVHHYNAAGKLINSSKYKEPRYLETFRTPGL